MTDRVKFLIQKRISLKSQLTGLVNILDKGKTNNTSLKLRMNRITELFHAFEDHNDELVILEQDEGHQDECMNIQERYYAFAARVENILQAANMSEASTSASHDENRSDDGAIATTVKRRRIKLPQALLPTFDGKFENWLSFKNTFNNLIGRETDLSDLDKLQYLKSALTGEAANKIRIFENDEINYTQAWEILDRAYEVKRVLISRHMTAVLNPPALETETTSGLTKLADDMQQHVASLKSLGVSVGSEVIVVVLESKLPKSASERWDAKLDRNEFPKAEEMYEFLYKSAVFASKRERTRSVDTEKIKGEPPAKRRRVSFASNQALVLNTSRNCTVCKNKRHPLYLCEKFKQLSVQKRIDAVKGAKVCYNCMRSHKGSVCKFSSCTICQRRHNTLLHLDSYSNAKGSDASSAASAKSE